jgi:hypothetical protein
MGNDKFVAEALAGICGLEHSFISWAADREGGNSLCA